MQMDRPKNDLPEWVPINVARYVAHTEHGMSIRELARRDGCHASTVLRQIRKLESLRDDPLIDAALDQFKASDLTVAGQKALNHRQAGSESAKMPELEVLCREGRRVLRRLCETGAVLAVAKDMAQAVVVRDRIDGAAARTAVVSREIAQAMALKDWISCTASGRISRYTITAAGRAALNRLVAADENKAQGFGDSQTPFADQHRDRGATPIGLAGRAGQDGKSGQSGQPRRMRFNMAESPLAALSRRREKDGSLFLDGEMVAAGERLREDFELAQMGPRVGQNWERFLSGSDCTSYRPDSGVGNGPQAARQRVADALNDLGDGLSDVALRCCCFLQGLETTEKRLGWSARSGKIVLRIALGRLRDHYRARAGGAGDYIG